MGRIEIRKYEFASGHLANYFDSPTYIDTLVLNKISVQGMPVYNKEYEKQFEAFAIQFSDVTLKFLLTHTETSDLSKTIRTFFEDNINNHCLAVKIEIDGDETIGGLIDIESIWFDETLNSDGYNLTFTVWGFEREFKKLGDRPPFIASAVAPLFQVFINQSFFRNGNPGYWAFNTTELDWANITGYEPVLVTEMWAQLIQKGKLDNAKIWDLFTDLLKFYGIVYEGFTITGTNGNYFRVETKLIFRSNPNATTISITKAENPQHGYIRNKKSGKWIFWKTGIFAGTEDSGNEIFYGILSNGQTNYYARGARVSGVGFDIIEHARVRLGNLEIRNYEYPDPPGFAVSLSDVTIIEFSNYFETVVLDSVFPSVYRQWLFKGDTLYPDPFEGQNYSFPVFWTRTGYNIQIIGAYKLIQNSSFNVYASMQQAWKLMGYADTVTFKSPYKFLYRGFLFKVFELILPFSQLPANTKLFTKSNIYNTAVILYKLKQKDWANRKVKSIWYQTENV